MTGGPYKGTPLTENSPIATVDKRSFAGLAQVDHSAWVRLLEAQDVAFSKARRMIAALTLGGEDTFQAADAVRWGESWSIVPEDSFYSAHRAKGWLAPGSVIGVSILYVESGATTNALTLFGMGTLYRADRVYGGGAAQIFASFNGGNSKLFKRPLKVSEYHNTFVGDTNGALRWNIADDAWSQLHLVTGTIDHMTGASLETQDAISEWCEYELIIGYTGGARIVDMAIYEVPRTYSQSYEHGEEDRSLHGIVSVSGLPVSMMTQRIQERGNPDSNGQEPRFGTRKAMGVAHRQTKYMGPRIMHWGPFSQARVAAYDDDTPDADNLPYLVSTQSNTSLPASATLRNVFGSSTVYDANLTGFFPDGTLALERELHVNVPGRLSSLAWVPVTVHVYGSVSAGTGILAVQSGELDLVQVPITTTLGWHSARGWIRVPRAAHVNPAANTDPECLILRYSTNGTATMTLGSVCVDYGWDR